MGYGTGAIMAVPAHDERDFQFATEFGLPIVEVIAPPAGAQGALARGLRGRRRHGQLRAVRRAGRAGRGLRRHRRLARRARPRPAHRQLQAARLAHQPAALLGRADPDRLLRRAAASCPCPRSSCPCCCPTSTTSSRPTTASRRWPGAEAFVHTTCPSCGGPARRETDTMDTFACSSWYHLRFPSPHYDEGPFDRAAVDYWLPVDLYVGGAEHAVMHLLYARFFCKVLQDAGHVGFGEPYARLRNQGMIQAEDGQKMSKSKGNVVTPDSVVERYGADSLRVYELFIAPFEQSVAWSDRGVQGCYRFLGRFWNLVAGRARGRGQRRRRRRGRGREGPPGPAHPAQDDPQGHRRHGGLPLQHRRLGADGAAERGRSTCGRSARGALDASPQWRELLAHDDAAAGADGAARRRGGLGAAGPGRLRARRALAGLGRGARRRRGRHRGRAGQRQAARPPAGGRRRRRRTTCSPQAKAAGNTARFLDGKQVVKEIYVPGKLVNFVVR